VDSDYLIFGPRVKDFCEVGEEKRLSRRGWGCE